VTGLPTLEAREPTPWGLKWGEVTVGPTGSPTWTTGVGGRGVGKGLVFYLDLSDGAVDPQGTLSLIFLTESPQDCLYRLTVNLGAFE